MDISIQDWPDKLRPLLGHIAKARFVAIDFEISGISMKSNSSRAQTWRQQTLQERYEDVKTAAEKYQILQVGITTVIEDERTGTYLLHPYNIHLSPLIRESLGIDRTFSVQSSSIRFLQGHDFKMEKPFTIGVPYLSRHEEAQVREKVAGINSNPKPRFWKISNPAKREFTAKIKTTILEWLEMEEKPDFLNIGPEHYDHAKESSRGFTQAEGQLIHGLVKAEFPHLASHNVTGYIRVNSLDAAAIAKRNADSFEARLQLQIGLRYLFDGMTYGDSLQNIDILSCFTPNTAPRTYGDQQKVLEQFEEVKERLQKPTVLVGHNVFTDLVNFYACFIGPLPEKVEDFQKQIHSLFPLVIDTKYLAAQLGRTSGLRSRLTELHYELKDMPLPRVKCHPHHIKYNSGNFFGHEAGYDSYITAQLMIRLSASLEALTRPETQPGTLGSNLIDFGEEPDAGNEKSCSEELAAAFGIDLALSDTQPAPAEVPKSAETNNSTNMQISEFIPLFETQFWHSYGNRIAVGGTMEKICYL